MKKHILALAALAASGASFAQVAITGTLAMGYQVDNLASGAQASGLGIDTSTLTFTASEDLGGGQKIAASLGFDGVNRAAANGGDTSLTYTNNSIGQFALATKKSGTYFAAVAELGLPFIGMDGKVQETLSSSDSISYTVPVGPVYVSLKHAEHDKGIGLGVGVTGTTALNYPMYQNNNEIDVYYAAGALKLLGVLRQYDNRQESAATISGLPANMFPVKKDLTNVQASYDLGMMKVGAGYQQVTTVAGAKQTDMELTAALPMGSWTVGMLVGKSVTSDATSKMPGGFAWDTSLYNGTANVFGMTVDYAFSKRTSLTLKYATWTPSGYIQYGSDLAAAPGTHANQNGAGGLNWGQTASETALLLTHNF